MNKIEYTNFGFDDERMRKEVPEYDSDQWLPKGIKYIENTEHKEEIFKLFPESYPHGFERNTDINQMMHMRIGKEVKENPDIRICYLLVSHGATIDCAATSFKHFEDNQGLRPSF